MLEEPESIHKAVTISLDNIVQRIQLQKAVQPVRNIRNCCGIPQNRGCPHADIQNYIDNLAEIAEKRCDGTGQIGKYNDETDHRKGIVPDLDNLNRRKLSPQSKTQTSKHNKEQMYKQGRNHLHKWKHTDLKYNLLYQVTVFQQTI